MYYCSVMTRGPPLPCYGITSWHEISPCRDFTPCYGVSPCHVMSGGMLVICVGLVTRLERPKGVWKTKSSRLKGPNVGQIEVGRDNLIWMEFSPITLDNQDRIEKVYFQVNNVQKDNGKHQALPDQMLTFHCLKGRGLLTSILLVVRGDSCIASE